MASPQKEDGYTPIANELFEAIISSDFSKRQLLVIMAIARMTYGYSKKSDALSALQISKLVNIDHSDCKKTLNELLELHVVTKHENGRTSHGVFVSELSINKDYESWLTRGDLPLLTGGDLPTGGEIPLGGKTPLLTGGETPQKRGVKHPSHKAIKTIKQDISKKRHIPADFTISERVKTWAEKNGHKNLNEHLEYFILVCEKNNNSYANWDSAFITAIRDNWAKIKTNVAEKDDRPFYQRNVI